MMYMIGLAAKTFDPDGAFQLPWRDGMETKSIRRRVSRRATLDKSVVVTDRGYVAGDRTIKLSLAGEKKEMVERARRLLQLHSQVTISLDDGCFDARMSDYDENRKILTVLITGVA